MEVSPTQPSRPHPALEHHQAIAPDYGREPRPQNRDTTSARPKSTQGIPLRQKQVDHHENQRMPDLQSHRKPTVESKKGPRRLGSTYTALYILSGSYEHSAIDNSMRTARERRPPKSPAPNNPSNAPIIATVFIGIYTSNHLPSEHPRLWLSRKRCIYPIRSKKSSRV